MCGVLPSCRATAPARVRAARVLTVPGGPRAEAVGVESAFAPSSPAEDRPRGGPVPAGERAGRGAVDRLGRTDRAAPTASEPTAAAAKKKPKPNRPTKYTPSPGPTFNNPYGPDASRRAIIRKLLNTIDAVPKRGEIRIASWNIRSLNITAALLRAHNRGVSVQVVMDRSNWNPREPQPGRRAAQGGPEEEAQLASARPGARAGCASAAARAADRTASRTRSSSCSARPARPRTS